MRTQVIKDARPERATVRRLTDGGFLLATPTPLALEGGLLLDAMGHRPWRPRRFEDVTLDDLLEAAAREAALELVLLGVGAASARAPLDWALALKERAGCAFEAMPTRAAVGVYAALTAEGRAVAAALVPR